MEVPRPPGAPSSASLSSTSSPSGRRKDALCKTRGPIHPSRLILSCSFLVVLAALPLHIAAQSIFTHAGGGTDDGRPATLAALYSAEGVAIDAKGNIFVVDYEHGRVRRISAKTGIIETVAGNGTIGFGGDGRPGTLASLGLVEGIAVDRDGNLYIADYYNNCVRRVDAASGVISTIAGRDPGLGSGDFGGDGGPATAAWLRQPRNLTFDSSGNLYIVDAGNYRIRKIDTSPQQMITTIAGNGQWGSGGDGGPATAASFKLLGPQPNSGYVPYVCGIAVDRDGNVYVADPFDHRVRKISRIDGRITAVAGTGTQGSSGDGGPATQATLDSPQGIALSSGGRLFIAERSRIRQVDLASSVISTLVELQSSGLALDAGENVVASQYAAVVRVTRATGTITRVAGTGRVLLADEGGPATAAAVLSPAGITLGASGDLFIAETGSGRVRRVSSKTGAIETIAGVGLDTLTQGSGDGGPATKARIQEPSGVAFDALGNLLIVEVGPGRVRRVAAGSGTITTVAGVGDHGSGFSGDGGLATAARLDHPRGIAVGASGDLYIVDEANHRIRRVAASTGIITTFAGNGSGGSGGDGGQATAAALNNPLGIAVDSRGDILVTEYGGHRVRRVSASTGVITTAAGTDRSGSEGDGGPATAASLSQPTGVAVDGAGNIYISEAQNRAIRKIDARSGTITTIAGSRLVNDSSGDAGPATRAGLASPYAVAVSAGGDVYIGDFGADRVRKVPACITVPPAPLVSPSNGSSGISTPPKLEWQAAPGAFRYDLYLDTKNPPSRIIESDIATTTAAPSNLEPLTTYYWRVVAKGDPFCVPPSAAASVVRSFTTEESCAVPGAFGGTP